MSIRSHLRALRTLGRGVYRGITELEEHADPIALFQRWFADARDAGLFMPEAMTLATTTADGRPCARMMLLKRADADGFVFYTNYGSRKAAELAENPRAALVFHWNLLQRQVRIEGTVERTSRAESEAYFRTRPRGSQLGAWASRQSAELASREELERRFREHRERFAGREIPLPEFWGGYRLRPERIEFWQGRANRLHDRLEYRRVGSKWEVRRLYP